MSDAPFELAALDLEGIRKEVWKRLERATVDRRSPFRTPTLSTWHPEHGCRARTVVLRRARASQNALAIHTDRRSAKLAHLDAEPRIALAFYDAKAKLQVLAEGRATVHIDDDVMHAAYDRMSTMSRRAYAISPAPGTVVDTPPPSSVVEDRDQTIVNFAYVTIDVMRIEWLYLHHGGHKRAVFTPDDASWRVP